MGYTLESHTADIRLIVTGNDFKALCANALCGMAHILKPDFDASRKEHQCVVEMSSVDSTILLIDFLNEILTQSHIDRTVYHAIEWTSLTNTSLSATVYGAATTSFDEDIKAVTYHEADIVPQDDGTLKTTIVFDI